LIDPEKKPEKKKEEPAKAAPTPRPAVDDPYAPPKVSPFGGSNYAAPSGTPKRWVGLPVIGIAILGIRLLLLCGRVSSPSYTPSYNYQPYNLPLPMPTAAAKAPVVVPGPLAVSKESDVVWFAGKTLHRRDAANKESTLLVTAPTAAASLDSLAVGGNRACWIADHSSVYCVEDTRTMAQARLLFAGSAIDDLRVDADGAYFVEESWKNSDTAYTLARVDFRTRTRTELLTSTGVHHLVLDGASLYFVGGKKSVSGTGEVTISRVAKTGGTPKTLAVPKETPERLVVQGDDIFFTAPGGVEADYAMTLHRMPKAGGTPTRVNLAEESLEGDFAVNDKSIYFVGTGDALYRVARSGGTPAELTSVTARVSRLALNKKTIEYTPVGQLTPQSAPLAD
jgi:hypothetical protein